MSQALRAIDISKRFGSVVALDNVSFSLERGEVHALLGVNGAGKSTLVKILSGLYTADTGEIHIDGAPATIRSPRDAIDHGIASVQQHPELVPDLSGYENIFLGQEASKPGLLRKIDDDRIRRLGDALLQRFPIDIDLSKKVRDMAGVERETVAILHALRQEHVKVLILDEPTSTLTLQEARVLFDVMSTLRTSGIGIIYITHRLEEVFQVADRFTVFRDGHNIATHGTTDGSHDSASVTGLMLQEEMGQLFPPKAEAASADTDTVLEARNLSGGSDFQGVNITLKRGEILGGFGLVGSGIEALALTLFGGRRPTGGEIYLNRQPTVLNSPSHALNSGIFLVPGERKTQGLTLTEDVVFNGTLANLERASNSLGLLKHGRNQSALADILQQLDLRPFQLWRKLSGFSGGNQQKVVLAKGIFSQADIYIFVEPTVGVDIGARAKLYAIMRDLSKTCGVLVLSSDFEEVFGIADTVFALYRGQMSLPPSRDVSRDTLLFSGLTGEKR